MSRPPLLCKEGNTACPNKFVHTLYDPAMSPNCLAHETACTDNNMRIINRVFIDTILCCVSKWLKG